jgi:hypothetical protein
MILGDGAAVSDRIGLFVLAHDPRRFGIVL